MTDVFISYSRKDTEFVRRLHAALAEQKRDIWVDWEDIPATADWWAEVQAGIEAANSFVFVISPDSVMSDICRNEVEHAVSNNKRMVPIMFRDISDPALKPVTHAAINSHNWIFFRDEAAFDQSFQLLLKALDTDLNYVREHTRLLVRAREWEARGYHPGFLLTRTEMKESRDWLDQSEGKDPRPTTLQMEYIQSSQQALNRQRRFQITLVSALITASILAIISVFLFQQADSNRVLAEANASTSDANAVIAFNNAVTATLAQGEAQIQASTAIAAQGTSAYNAADAATQASNARANASTSDANAVIAFNNAVTATVAQGEAVLQAQNAETQAAIAQQEADANATAQSVARSEANANATAQQIAQVEAFNAATAAAAEADARATSVVNEGIAIDSAATATIALGNLQVQTRHSMSLGLAAQAQIELNGPAPERSILLGLEALQNYDYTWQAEQALGLAVQGSRLRHILMGHDAPVYAAVYSPDGTKIVTSSVDMTAKIWDSATGDLLQTLTGHTEWVNAAAWSPDGFQVATASDDGTARIWDAETGQELFTLKGHTDYVVSVAWSPDGTKIATASYDGTAIIWDAKTGQPTIQPIQAKQNVLYNVTWSPDSTTILTIGYDNTAVLWSARTGAFISRFRGHTDTISAAAWSPNGSQLVTASADQTAIIWDVQSTKAIRVLSGHAAPIYGVDWSSDGTTIATASGDGTVKIWDVALSTAPLTLSVSVVYTVDLSPDGQHFVTTGSDNGAKIWEIKPAGERFTIHPTESMTSNVQWSPDGRFLAGGVQQGTTVWDSSNGAQRRDPFLSRGGDVLKVAWSPDGTKVLVAKYTQLVEVWSSMGELLLSLDFGTSERTGSITSLAWSPDGTQIAASGQYDPTTIWDAATGKVLFTLTNDDNSSGGTFVTWAPQGEYILTGNDNTVRSWTADTGERDAEISQYGAEFSSLVARWKRVSHWQ